MKPSFRSTDENLAYFRGGHFDVGWIGPTIPPTAPDYAEKMAHLRRVFQQANLIRECVSNWRDGLLSEPFNWFLKTADGDRADAETDATASAAEQDLQRWLDWVAQQSVQTDPSTTNFEQADPWNEFVLSLGVLGEGNLRLWQPERYAEADPIQRIHLHAPKVGSVGVARADDGFIDEISYTYGQNRKEVQRMDPQGRIVLSDGDGNDLAGDDGETLPPLDTGGRWLIQHARMPSLLTPSIKALQNSINHALTMKLRNNEVAGFREKVFANAEFPDDGVERGPGRDLYVYGVPTGDQSNPSYTTPTVFESQPVSTQSLVDSVTADRAMLYREFSQSHLLGDSDAGLSGESRIQQRQAFELALRGAAGRIESAIGNVLNIVLRLLDYQGYEVVVQLQVTTGKLSSEEQKTVIAQYQAGLLSRTTAMAMLGIKDPDAEMALIEAEQSTAPRQQANGLLAGGLSNPIEGR